MDQQLIHPVRPYRKLASTHFRRKKAAPPFSIVEQAVLPTLFCLSVDANRLYATLCRFAARRTGFAYPSAKRLLHDLGVVPYHTDFLTGRVRVGLTTKQRETRRNQMNRFLARLSEATSELIEAGLIARSYVLIGQAGEKQQVEGFYILHLDRRPRNLRNLKYRSATFVIPGWLLDIGTFGFQRPHWRSGFDPVPDTYVRILLLALRDNDELSFGGIDPSKARIINGEVHIERAAWPDELPYSVPQFIGALTYALERKILMPWTAIYSAEFGQLLDASSRDPVMPHGETALTVLRFR